MRIVCFSDTHKLHKEVVLPVGDIAVFAGDMCGGGSEKSARRFAEWFSLHQHPYKVVVAGNHDKCFENGARLIIRKYLTDLGIIYLEHEPELIGGLKFFGSPYTPEFCSWAFNVPRGEELERKWSQIPDNTEVLVTHGPPLGTLDHSIYDDAPCGCGDLAYRIKELKNLKLHIFGHIHFSRGMVCKDGVTYVNACVCGENYKATNEPIIVDL
jgi:Icc-related predicted phosphoesterase